MINVPQTSITRYSSKKYETCEKVIFIGFRIGGGDMIVQLKKPKKGWEKCLIICAIFIISIYSRISGSVATWAIGVGIIVIILAVTNITNIGYSIQKSVPFVLLILPMVFITLLSCLEGDISINSIYRIIVFWMMYLIGIIISSKEDDYIISSYNYFYRIGFLFVVYGLIEWIRRDNFLIPYLSRVYAYSSVGTSEYRISSFFVHPIVYANILLIMLVINIYRDCSSRSRYVGYLMILISLFATSTRGAWLIAAQILIMELIDNFKTKISLRSFMVILFVIVFLIAGICIGNSYLTTIAERFLQLSGSNSLNYRLSIIMSYVNAVFKSNIINIIFGHGYSSARNSLDDISSYNLNIDALDNQWITLLYDGGLFIFIVLAVVFIYCVIKFFKSHNRINKLLLLMIIISLEEMFFYDTLSWQVSSMFFIIPAAIYFNRRSLDVLEVMDVT